MSKIKVGNNHAIVDQEDLGLLNKYSWHLHSCGYAAWRGIKNGEKQSIYMHRLLTNAPKGLEVDHINMNRLDNRKVNLRVCNKGQNRLNENAKKGSKSKYKGVYYNNTPGRRKRWVAQIGMNRSLKNLGYFYTEEEAAKAYDKAAKDLHGEFGRLNFG